MDFVRFPSPVLKEFWQDGFFDHRQPRAHKHKTCMRVRLDSAHKHQLCALLNQGHVTGWPEG